MPEVSVAIPTFRRPLGLQRLLAALAQLDTAASVTVLIADNDSDKHEGFDLCEALRSKGYRWPLRAVIVAERGIAAVRNALVANALADPKTDFVAMLDDDEWPEPRWLDRLLAEQTKTNAGAVQGSILFAFDEKPAAWMRSFDGVSDIRHASGPADMLQGAGNILVTRTALERLTQPWFDPAFALGGGEDFDFFMRLKQAGATFAWSDEAIAHSSVSDTRITMGWALKRAYSIGNSDMRVFLKYRPTAAARAAELVKIAGAFLFAPVLFLANAFDDARRADALRRLWRAAGKCAALFGHRYDEYAVTHGR
ncbi:MAG: glycosyltransferase [Alphaproteobacteria bacterium]|nr:glycosyltransferase [Alphaproteobacteria bacterium]MBL6937636.1 glycosyltransferase [Alphaproteobacteria bacterium]MBL7098974.1 glycosyltransferase [Alphaproteobacteria bacterium]